MAISWHGPAVDGDCVPGAALQVVAAEHSTATDHYTLECTPKRAEDVTFVPLPLQTYLHRAIG